jgi:glutathionyl-hydroquinone reductase
VFARLDEFDERLATQRYLLGDRLTDYDVRLYTMLIRFDIEYYGGFLVNQKRIMDYPNLWGYARDLYQTKGFGNTTDFVGIKQHYYQGTHRVEMIHCGSFRKDQMCRCGMLHMEGRGCQVVLNQGSSRNLNWIWTGVGHE